MKNGLSGGIILPNRQYKFQPTKDITLDELATVLEFLCEVVTLRLQTFPPEWPDSIKHQFVIVGTDERAAPKKVRRVSSGEDAKGDELTRDCNADT